MSIDRDPCSVNCGAGFDGQFAASLDLSGNAWVNHILTITLRVYVEGTDQWSNIAGRESDPRFAASAWASGELDQYKVKLKEACEKIWDKKITLIPPLDATDFQVGRLNPFVSTYQPNINCRFVFDTKSSVGNRHWKLSVYKGAAGVHDDDAKTGMGSANIDKSDIDAVERTVNGVTMFQTAAAHEVGHMLGQPHAGVLRGNNDCLRAVKLNLKSVPSDGSEPSYIVGGPNASACYGLMSGKLVPGVFDNIMGIGNALTEDNAITWLRALARVQYDKPKLDDESQWKVVVGAFIPLLPRKVP